MASPSPTTTHEARAAAWRRLWDVLLAEPDESDEASDPPTEPAENHEEAAQTAA